MNDLLEFWGSGRLGVSCHSLRIIDDENKSVSKSFGSGCGKTPHRMTESVARRLYAALTAAKAVRVIGCADRLDRHAERMRRSH
jgi:hypothetical protein